MVSHAPAKMRVQSIVVPNDDIYRGSARILWEGGLNFPGCSDFRHTYPVTVSREGDLYIAALSVPDEDGIATRAIGSINKLGRAYRRVERDQVGQALMSLSGYETGLDLPSFDHVLVLNRQVLLPHTVVHPVYRSMANAARQEGNPAGRTAGQNATGHRLPASSVP